MSEINQEGPENFAAFEAAILPAKAATFRQLDAEELSEALSELPILFRDQWDFARLANAINRGLAVAESPWSELPRLASRSNAAKLLRKQAMAARNLHQALDDLSATAVWRIIQFANDKDGSEHCLSQAPEAVSFRRFGNAKDELAWLGWFLEAVATAIPPTRRWKDGLERERRIIWGWALGAIFEAAFSQPAEVNEWRGSSGSGRSRKPTEFMLFCERVIKLAFDKGCTPDLPGVLQESVRRLRANPPAWP